MTIVKIKKSNRGCLFFTATDVSMKIWRFYLFYFRIRIVKIIQGLPTRGERNTQRPAAPVSVVKFGLMNS